MEADQAYPQKDSQDSTAVANAADQLDAIGDSALEGLQGRRSALPPNCAVGMKVQCQVAASFLPRCKAEGREEPSAWAQE